MFTRTLSRLATTGLVAGALVALPSAAALGYPPRDPLVATSVNASGNVTAGTDVAAPDQQNPIPAAETGPVPQPPTWPENPQPLPSPTTVPASSGPDFQWDDAGIGAGGALAVVLVGIGGVAVIRRRGAHGGALAA